MRSLTEPDLYDTNVHFNNTTPIYLINMLYPSPIWKCPRCTVTSAARSRLGISIYT